MKLLKEQVQYLSDEIRSVFDIHCAYDGEGAVDDIMRAVTFMLGVPEKPIVGYLATILERFGEYESTSTVFLDSDDEKYLKEYAKVFRGSDDEDWDEEYEGYWFDGNLVFLPQIIRGLTQSERDLWETAQALESPFFQNMEKDVTALEAWDRLNRDL